MSDPSSLETFLHRYDLDTSQPSAGQWRTDLLRRALGPIVVLWIAIVALGLVIVGPLGGLPGEVAVNEALVESRSPGLNAATEAMSLMGSTEFIIGVCVIAVVVLYWRTRWWWFAVVPPLAVALQALVFMTSALVVGRGRPEVEKLDDSPPTSGFPSGHTGASTAFYVTLALLVQRINNPVLRVIATVVCLAVPVLVAYARLYRGMHHLSDVIVGALNGLICAYLAWSYLRRDVSGQTRA